jgi:Arc/MetJ-type ribon-helix-helix transcriptional regulator
MNYPLPADLQQRIDAQLATGGFVNAEEVMPEAIEALERRQRGLAELREMIAVADEDVATGRINQFDLGALKLEVRNRLAERVIRD